MRNPKINFVPKYADQYKDWVAAGFGFCFEIKNLDKKNIIINEIGFLDYKKNICFTATSPYWDNVNNKMPIQLEPNEEAVAFFHPEISKPVKYAYIKLENGEIITKKNNDVLSLNE